MMIAPVTHYAASVNCMSTVLTSMKVNFASVLGEKMQYKCIVNFCKLFYTNGARIVRSKYSTLGQPAPQCKRTEFKL